MQSLHKNRASFSAGSTCRRVNRVHSQTRAIIATTAVVIAGILLVAAGMAIAAG